MTLPLALFFGSLFATAMQQPTASPTSAPPASSTPAPDTAPLPDIRQLMLDVERNQRRFEAAQQDYTYHVHTVEDELTSHGQLKKSTITDAESLSIDGVRVDKIVAKNGHPLTPDETKKESDRIDKEVAKAKEKRAKQEDKGRDTDSRGNEITSVSRMLELGAFTNPRRVTIAGRPAILLDYTGDPHAKTHNTLESIFRDLAGQVLIDEHDRVLIRGQGHFAADFKVGGGLVVDVHKGFSFDFSSTKINGEVWLPAQIDAQGSARFLLLVHVNGRLAVTTSDYRKYRTSTTIIPSNRLIGADGLPLPDQPDAGTPPATPPH
jgi:hypothetical protein